MKVVMKPIEMIAFFAKEGILTPIRYRFLNEEEHYTVIKVDRVIHRTEEKIAGNPMINYRCQSVIEGFEKIYELKYEIKTCKWFLFKI